MINFVDFYKDIEFMYALLLENKLTASDLKQIANRLIITDDNKYLINILISDENDNVFELFKKYVQSKNITINNTKKEIVKKIFFYILKNEIQINAGIDFLHYEISDYSKDKQYIGDNIGIEKILGNYISIDDGDITDKKHINKIKQEIIKDMQKYIDENE